jgi:hypothetical protein
VGSAYRVWERNRHYKTTGTGHNESAASLMIGQMRHDECHTDPGEVPGRHRLYFGTHLPASMSVAFGQVVVTDAELAAATAVTGPDERAATAVKPRLLRSTAELARATTTRVRMTFMIQPFRRARRA